MLSGHIPRGPRETAPCCLAMFYELTGNTPFMGPLMVWKFQSRGATAWAVNTTRLSESGQSIQASAVRTNVKAVNRHVQAPVMYRGGRPRQTHHAAFHRPVSGCSRSTRLQLLRQCPQLRGCSCKCSDWGNNLCRLEEKYKNIFWWAPR